MTRGAGMRFGLNPHGFSNSDSPVESLPGFHSLDPYARLRSELTELVPMAPVSVPASSPMMRQPSTSAAIQRLYMHVASRSMPCSPHQRASPNLEQLDRNGDQVVRAHRTRGSRLFTRPANHEPEIENTAIRMTSSQRLHSHALNTNIDGMAESDWLDIAMCECDGGERSSDFGVLNALRNDPSVYSTLQSKNVNMLLKCTSSLTYQQAVPFSLQEVCIRVPPNDCGSSLKNGFIFVCNEGTALDQFDAYNFVDTSRLLCTSRHPSEVRLPQVPHFVRTVLYFNLDPNALCFRYKFQTAIPDAQYLFVKLLNSVGRTDHIDVQFLGFKGNLGKMSFPEAYIN